MKASAPVTPERALARLQELCARSEQCTGEALERLRRMGLRGSVAHEIVQQLVDQRFIDDERYARAYVRDKHLFARWGRIKIRQALRLKQLEREDIDTAINEEIDPDAYVEQLAALMRSRLRGMAGVPWAEAVPRLVRFAASRGFEPGLIMELIHSPGQWLDIDNEDSPDDEFDS